MRFEVIAVENIKIVENMMLTPCSFLDRHQRVERNLPTRLWKQQAR
jgi:hypothetical protein